MAEPAVDSLWSYAVAGYLLTAVVLIAYLGTLFSRARRARARAAALAAGRRGIDLGGIDRPRP